MSTSIELFRKAKRERGEVRCVFCGGLCGEHDHYIESKRGRSKHYVAFHAECYQTANGVSADEFAAIAAVTEEEFNRYEQTTTKKEEPKMAKSAKVKKVKKSAKVEPVKAEPVKTVEVVTVETLRGMFTGEVEVNQKREGCCVWITGSLTADDKANVKAMGFRSGTSRNYGAGWWCKPEDLKPVAKSEPEPKPVKVKAAKPKPKSKSKAAKSGGKYEPGTVFVKSYGYNMTLVNFYEVTRCTAKTVWVREIYQKVVEDTGYMSGRCAPVEPHVFVGDKEHMYRIKPDSDYIGSGHDFMHVWDGRPAYFNHMD